MADKPNSSGEPHPNLRVLSEDELKKEPRVTQAEIKQALEEGREDRDGALANTNTQLGNPRVLFR